MKRLVIHLVVNAVALYAAVRLVPGIHAPVMDAGGRILTFLAMALIFGMVNACVRPMLKLLTCPMILVTLGLFIFVINALMLMLAAWFARVFGLGFSIDGFWPAFFGALVVSIVSYLLNLLVRDDRHQHQAS